MKRVALFTVLLAVTFAARAFALTAPDFSGTWVLDSVADAAAPGSAGVSVKGKLTLVIKQTKTTFSVERKEGERSETAKHKLDGTESVNKLPSGREKRSRSAWAGSTLVIKSRTDMGGLTVRSREDFSLSRDGKVLTIDATVQLPKRESKQKMTYKRK